METLKPIPDFFDYYASDRGFIYSIKSGSLKKMASCTKRTAKESSQRHYQKLALCRNGKRVTRVVHRLVYLAFYGSINKGWHVHHIDGDSENNSIDNLEQIHPLEHKSLHTF